MTVRRHNASGMRAGLTLVVVTWALLGVTARAAGALARPIDVFVSILPQKYFAERIGGQRVHVSVMVGPGRSPATYEPTPRQLSALSKARLYWRIGVPFEAGWMGRIEAANPHMRVLDARDGIRLRSMEGAAGLLSGEAPRRMRGGVKDPHIWLSPPLVKIMCAHLRDTLTALDPAGGARYEANYAAFAAQLDRLNAHIRALFAPVKHRRFMDFHPAWGYFAHTYGLTQIPIEIEGKEPGPRTLIAAIQLAKRERIRVIFVQAQFSRRDAEAVAQAVGARVVAVDPLAVDYPRNMLNVAEAFRAAMR